MLIAIFFVFSFAAIAFLIIKAFYLPGSCEDDDEENDNDCDEPEVQISTEDKPQKSEKKHFNKTYVVFEEHIERCHLTDSEYENLWWDQWEEPNTTDEMLNDIKFYEFTEGYDAMDPGLISGYTTRKYLLDLYAPEEEVAKQYPIVGKILAQHPPIYNYEIHGKRHMTEEEIKEATKICTES